MKIYIGNLPEGGHIKEDVQRLFSRYGETRDCVIIKEYGFIHMEEEAANKAIQQLDGFKLEGKRMRVEKSIHNSSRMEVWNPVSDDNYSRTRNNILPPFNSARGDDLSLLGNFYCSNLAGPGLGDHSFKRRLGGPSVFRDSGLYYALGNSVGNCSCNNLCGLSRTVCGYNCGMLGGCNDGRFNRMAGDGHHRCNKPGGFNTVSGNNLGGFGGTVDNVYGCWSGCAYGCKGAVNDCNNDSLRNTASDTTYEGMGGVVVKEEKDMDIKMEIKKLKKTIKTEEGKPLINEKLVNDWRNQVNYLERKIQHLETEKTENQLRSQVKDLQKRVRDLLEEKKIYKDQNPDDNNARSLLDYQNSQRSSKANKRVKHSRTESSSKRGCSIESKQKQSSMSDDDIKIIDASDDEEIKIVDESEEDDVEIVSESKLKQNNIFKNRGSDDNENNISENEVNEVEIITANGSKRRKSSMKDGSKNRMLSENFDEKGAWGVVKCERGYDEDIPVICLDEEDDVKDIKKDKDDNQVKIENDSMSNSSFHEMLNMSDELGEVLNEIDDERPFQGVPPLCQVLGVPHHDAM